MLNDWFLAEKQPSLEQISEAEILSVSVRYIGLTCLHKMPASAANYLWPKKKNRAPATT